MRQKCHIQSSITYFMIFTGILSGTLLFICILRKSSYKMQVKRQKLSLLRLFKLSSIDNFQRQRYSGRNTLKTGAPYPPSGYTGLLFLLSFFLSWLRHPHLAASWPQGASRGCCLRGWQSHPLFTSSWGEVNK